MMPMRANIVGPSCSATSKRARGLPFFAIVFGLGRFGDVFCGVAQRDQWFPTLQYDRITVDPMTPKLLHEQVRRTRYEANHVRDYDLTGHVADMSKSTRMTRTGLRAALVWGKNQDI
jgi:hypothetical protein